MLSPKLRREITDHLHSFDDLLDVEELRELFTKSNQLLVKVLEENSYETRSN